MVLFSFYFIELNLGLPFPSHAFTTPPTIPLNQYPTHLPLDHRTTHHLLPTIHPAALQAFTGQCPSG